MSINKKLLAVRTHLRAKDAFLPSDQTTKAKSQKQIRKQKNLSLLETDINRLKALAEREGCSQAKLIGKALDAFEMLYGPLK